MLIVDDVLATGGTAAATARLVERLGGAVVGLAFLIELGFLGGRAELAGTTPIASLDSTVLSAGHGPVDAATGRGVRPHAWHAERGGDRRPGAPVAPQQRRPPRSRSRPLLAAFRVAAPQGVDRR